MADEENEELTTMTPMERARRVAGNVMQYIRDNPRKGYGGTAGLPMKEAGMAADLVDNTAEAREFLESPGVGTGAMAAMGLTGFPARELKHLTSKLTKDQITRLGDAIQERHLYDQISGELHDLRQTIFHADHNTLRMDYGMPPLIRGERGGKGGQLGGNLRANPDHPIVQRYYEVKDQLSKQ